MDDELLNQPGSGSIMIQGMGKSGILKAGKAFMEHSKKLGIDQLIEASEEVNGHKVRFRLRKEIRDRYLQEYDTLHLCETFHLHSQTNEADLESEILLSMLSGPLTFEYPSYAELAASVHIRMNIVKAACRTALAFHTSKIERPADYWTYSEARGFTIVPGKSLIEALRKATQPDVSGERYAFSCYRASEYVNLLAIAQVAATCNRALLQQLQEQWEDRAIMSRQFHDVFLREYGSMSNPLPCKYYIPGDRLWFRNPDERSADITGYEGSWIFYLGNGLFSNFWERDKPFTLSSKCIEIFHWRHGVYEDASGKLQMNEGIVEERVRASMSDPEESKRILELMMRLRDPRGVYAAGGCIDATRECPRFVCPASSDIFLPEE